MQALKASETVLEAPDMPGVHFTTLYRKMRRYGLNR